MTDTQGGNVAARVVSRFSCGDCSAVATKLALRKYGHDRVWITYCDPGSEHAVTTTTPCGDAVK